jgi:hypothetical protein
MCLAFGAHPNARSVEKRLKIASEFEVAGVIAAENAPGCIAGVRLNLIIGFRLQFVGNSAANS